MGNAKPLHPFRAADKTRKYAALLAEVESIRRNLIDLETSSLIATSGVIPVQRESARNLLHYIAYASMICALCKPVYRNWDYPRLAVPKHVCWQALMRCSQCLAGCAG